MTSVDKMCQYTIKSIILRDFPNHSFLGEEDISPGIDAAEKALLKLEKKKNLWIVDPIDGTTNFAHGIPLCGVIIAFCESGILKFALIYDPARKEMFTAWRGGGAFMNGQRINCCPSKELKTSVVATGSPPNFKSLDACLRGTTQLSKKVRTMRILGSAAINFAWVANGRLTSYFEADLNVWDVAAGALLVQEAGGKVTDVWGQEYSLTTRNIVSSNGKIHSELLENLQEVKMWL